MRLQRLAHGVGAGLLAGLAGTAAMTASTRLEARLRGRHVPAPAPVLARNALGIERFASPAAEARFASLAHWANGALWGVAHGALRSVGLPARTATAAHTAVVWGGTLVVHPSHDIAPPVFMRPRREVALEAWHHAVYAAAAGLAFELLDGRA